ncbi:MAG TPA: 50S ribosomal protein L10 [Solirubrobacterales bacterium]|jgi:large subunit ribosomal protein L10
MNKEQKAAVVDEVATQIKESEAVFAVDYRGISVPQAAELREKLTEAGARFRVVKNTLTIRAADEAGAEDLKELLEGPTAFTFVAPESGDVALAAKALDRFRREHDMLAFKGGRMNDEPLTVDQLLDLAKLPARDVLHGQLVGVIASPITGLVRGLNQLIAGFASQLQQMVDQGLVGGEAEPAAEEPAAEEPEAEEPAAEEPTSEAPEEASQEAEQAAQSDEAADDAQESAGEGEGTESSTEGEQETETEEEEKEG